MLFASSDVYVLRKKIAFDVYCEHVSQFFYEAGAGMFNVVSRFII